ncbi:MULTISPECIES: EF-hand domain-containing protein [unclassified Sinorhizobium]|uniref:EF-hand domain-containing protein n=1 Tax=unclassified Sinorhizobium TaxID=2613772 RepID=UPI0024C366EE|nr:MULTISPECIES: EF-hand domain-containing protein [unclassified Sinorhizobium]MDK1377390.1 EF-hand domain-containing protein [Sinorhizobium sp. 6-70]MDK1478880.1 EF-hand domain-containing protein [Sinorhizobium sp. 6-117]
MIPTALLRSAAVAGLIALGLSAGASAQTTESEERRPDAPPEAEAQPSSPEGTMRDGDQPRERDMMGQDMMGQDMGRGMMGRMPMMHMRGHMMKIMFAIADADGDGSLSFDEVTAIHKRIFDKVDANKDGKVSVEEVQAFMRP